MIGQLIPIFGGSEVYVAETVITRQDDNSVHLRMHTQAFEMEFVNTKLIRPSTALTNMKDGIISLMLTAMSNEMVRSMEMAGESYNLLKRL